MSVLISPAPVLLGVSLTSCLQRRCVHVAFLVFWGFGFIHMSFERQLYLGRLEDFLFQDFLKVMHHYL